MTVSLPAGGTSKNVHAHHSPSVRHECAERPRLGYVAEIGETGTRLKQQVAAGFVTRLLGDIEVIQAGSLWRDVIEDSIWSRTGQVGNARMLVPMAFHCSTVDELERPTQVDYFTAPLAEWVNTFVLSHRPTLVGYEKPQRAARTANVGLETVQWFADRFGFSQEMACRVSRISTATFYAWKKRPETTVRPNTVRDSLRLRAAVEQLVSSVGALHAWSTLTDGSPALLEKLQHSGTWETALKGIQDAAQPAPRHDQMQYFTGVDDYLQGLDSLPSTDEDSDGIEGKQMTPEQVREARQWGWGQRQDDN